MIPQPHVCCACKKVVVMTDCLPAVCGACLEKERRQKEEAAASPDVVVQSPEEKSHE